MKFKYLKAGLASLILSTSCLVNTANAGLIVDNGFDVNASNGNSWTNTTQSYRTWDDFTLASDVIVTSASFLMQGSESSTYAFDIRADNAGTFGSSIFSLTLSAAEVAFTDVGLSFNQYDFALPSINLSAGTYWASFSSTGYELYGSKVGNFGTTMIQQINSTNYSRTNNYIPFQLNGTTTDVPEPSTLAIFALGMIGLASRRFKKQS